MPVEKFRESCIPLLAVQTVLALPEDMAGTIVNDVNDMSDDIRMENMHICVFPLETETVVLVFYHKRDRKYRKLRHQFNTISEAKALVHE